MPQARCVDPQADGQDEPKAAQKWALSMPLYPAGRSESPGTHDATPTLNDRLHVPTLMSNKRCVGGRGRVVGELKATSGSGVYPHTDPHKAKRAAPMQGERGQPEARSCSSTEQHPSMCRAGHPVRLACGHISRSWLLPRPVKI